MSCSFVHWQDDLNSPCWRIVTGSGFAMFPSIRGFLILAMSMILVTISTCFCSGPSIFFGSWIVCRRISQGGPSTRTVEHTIAFVVKAWECQEQRCCLFCVRHKATDYTDDGVFACVSAHQEVHAYTCMPNHKLGPRLTE